MTKAPKNQGMNSLEDVEAFLKAVNKEYGENALYFLGKLRPLPIHCIPTGSLALDLAIGGNERFMGIPLGRITEIWGPKDSGKTSLCYHIIANAQREGRQAIFLDYEHSFSPDYAENIGVDIDKLLFGQYTELEMGWQIIESIIRTMPGSVIVVDSIAAMTPRAEIEGEIGDTHVGLQPRRLAQAMRRNMGAVREHNVALLVTNQVRHKIGAEKWEGTETQAGGEALRHALGLQIDLYPSKVDKEGVDVTGRKIIARVSHSKIARPYCKAEYHLEFGKGIDRLPELVDFGVRFGALVQKGAYYYMPGEEKYFAQGKASAAAYLAENTMIAEAVDKVVRENTEDQGEVV